MLIIKNVSLDKEYQVLLHSVFKTESQDVFSLAVKCCHHIQLDDFLKFEKSISISCYTCSTSAAFISLLKRSFLAILRRFLLKT